MRGRLVFLSANVDRKESAHDYVRNCNRCAGLLCDRSVHDVATASTSETKVFLLNPQERLGFLK